jgi:hypothetical protein
MCDVFVRRFDIRITYAMTSLRILSDLVDVPFAFFNYVSENVDVMC